MNDMEIEDGECNACIATDCDDNSPEFFSTSMAHSRKERCCSECGETIPVGALYERAVGKWDGDLNTFITCAPCAEIADALCCDGRVYGGVLWEYASESLFDGMTSGCLAKLTTAAAKEKLMERWRKWKGI
jgi:hypothetical protein